MYIQHRRALFGRNHWRSRWRAERRSTGQAIVELALSLTLIMLLFAAAVDLGLAYKTYQTLVNAAAEASSYLDQSPSANCGTTTCNPIAEADRLARDRFRTEQGSRLRGVGSTMDLNANGQDDMTESGGTALVASMMQIDTADNTQIDATSGQGFSIKNNYNPAAADSQCKERHAAPQSTDAQVTSCYIVVRARIIYRPFVLRVILGEEMTIRAISVRRIVSGV